MYWFHRTIMYWFHRTKQILTNVLVSRTNKQLTQCIGFTEQNKTNINAMYWFHRTKQTLTQCIGFTEQNKN